MKKLGILLIGLFISGLCLAQDVIRGKVVDEAGSPIPFATISISVKNDSVPSAVRLTDNNGLFELKYDNNRIQTLKVAYLGYESLTAETKPVSDKLTDPLILTLKAKKNNLAEVTVTGRKKLITQKIDRLVLSISNNALTAGKSSLEIFSMAPGVFVNNGSISINGNRGTRVMINGKILQLTGDDLNSYLNNLRADDIESVEVIAHPPAEYEAQGTGGMLNIILKKQTSAGLNGSVNAGYTQGRYAGTNEGVRLNFREGKVSAFANYNFNKLKSYENSEMTRHYVDQPYQFAESARRIINDNGHRINTGAIYDISPKQYIAIDYVGSFSKRISPYYSSAFVDYNDQAENVINIGTFPTDTKTNYNNIGMNYSLALDKSGSGFQILADYTSNKLTKNSAANSAFYNYNNVFLSDTAFRNTTPSDASIYTADARYTKVLANKNSLSLGVKGASTVINNSAAFESLENGLWESNPEQDYIYDYKEKIIAGYFNYSGTVLNTSVKLGLRGEYTDMSGNLLTSNQLTKRDYFNLFPSLFLKRNLNKKGDNYLSLYYGRRLSRPSYNSLNPYESYINNYSVGRGNPYLTPSYSNVYEVGFTLKSKYSFKAGYQHDKDLVSQFIKVDDQNPLLWIYTFENYGRNRNLNFSANVPVSITKWWESNTNVQLRHQDISTPDLEIRKWIFYLQTNHDFRLSSKASINLNAYYISNVISGNLLTDKLYSVNIGGQYKLLSNRMLVRATVSDPFYTYKIVGTSIYKNYSSSVSQRRQSRTFNLSLTYNFDLGKSFKSKKLQKSSEEEEKRL